MRCRRPASGSIAGPSSRALLWVPTGATGSPGHRRRRSRAAALARGSNSASDALSSTPNSCKARRRNSSSRGGGAADSDGLPVRETAVEAALRRHRGTKQQLLVVRGRVMREEITLGSGDQNAAPAGSHRLPARGGRRPRAIRAVPARSNRASTSSARSAAGTAPSRIRAVSSRRIPVRIGWP